VTDVIKTSPVAPPSIALAIMACRLATHRAYGETRDISYMNANWQTGGGFMPTPRRYCAGLAGLEFYRILDRISEGVAP